MKSNALRPALYRKCARLLETGTPLGTQMANLILFTFVEVRAARQRFHVDLIWLLHILMIVFTGDFQFKQTRIDAEEIFKNSKEQLKPNSTVFIATDERDKKFFDPLKKHYNVWFLDDFQHALNGVNSNYFGMIDQLVASRGQTFFGCWFSTFTGFINRIRGYRSVKDKLPGYEQGVLPTSFYYATLAKKFEMGEYVPM